MQAGTALPTSRKGAAEAGHSADAHWVVEQPDADDSAQHQGTWDKSAHNQDTWSRSVRRSGSWGRSVGHHVFCSRSVGQQDT